MSDAELHDELITLLIAGHETTSSAIAWALYQIHRHPLVHQTLQAELAQFHKFNTPASVAQLPYLTAVCNETLRISPVVMLTVPREVRESIVQYSYEKQAQSKLTLHPNILSLFPHSIDDF
ncbi:cytochrome P450 [Phormidesmis sp. 146-33]